MRRTLIELELCNGKKIPIVPDWNKVYDLYEGTRRSFKLSKKFPFIEIVKTSYTSFKYRVNYETIDSIMDPRYKVNCSLVQLAYLFGVDIESFEQMMVNFDLEGQND